MGICRERYGNLAILRAYLSTGNFSGTPTLTILPSLRLLRRSDNLHASAHKHWYGSRLGAYYRYSLAFLQLWRFFAHGVYYSSVHYDPIGC